MDYEQRGPDHIATFPGVVCTFSRVHESRDDITGMLRVSLRGYPGFPDGDIYDSRIVLTGTTSHTSAAKACAGRVPDEDWLGLIPRACVTVRRSLEEGTPIVNLAEGETPEEMPYALEPLFRFGEAAVIFGAAATAKSTLGLAIAYVMTDGVARWGLSPSGPGRVLYLDYEDEEASLRYRLEMLAQGVEAGSRPPVLYKRAETSVPAMADALARQIAHQHITGLIVDSAGLACGAEPEAADSANAYFRAVRSLRLAWSVTIAHQPKAKDKDPLPFGSQFWYSNPRSIWRTQVGREEGKDTLHVALRHRKANNGQLLEPLAFTLHFYPGVGTTLDPIKARDVPSLREHASARDKVLGALGDAVGVLSYAELSEATGIDTHTLRTTINRLGGSVEKVGAGFRLLPPAGIG